MTCTLVSIMSLVQNREILALAASWVALTCWIRRVCLIYLYALSMHSYQVNFGFCTNLWETQSQVGPILLVHSPIHYSLFSINFLHSMYLQQFRPLNNSMLRSHGQMISISWLDWPSYYRSPYSNDIRSVRRDRSHDTLHQSSYPGIERPPLGTVRWEPLQGYYVYWAYVHPFLVQFWEILSQLLESIQWGQVLVSK